MNNNEKIEKTEIFNGLNQQKITEVKDYLDARLKNNNVIEIIEGEDTIFPINIVTDNINDNEIEIIKDFERELVVDIQQIVGENFKVFWYMKKIFVEPLNN
jgi:hypothetical protein